MKPKVTIFFVMIFYLSPLLTFTQSPEENLLKYWYYRDRLKYFVVPGENQGEGDMAGVRNRDLSLNLDFGQNCVYNGYYLGILATEFRILKDNGYIIDATNTEQELVYALQQFYNFLDRCEHWWGDPDLNDGYFIRTSVPSDFNLENDIHGKTSDQNAFFKDQYHHDILNHKLNDQMHYWTGSNFGDLPHGHPGACGIYIGDGVEDGSSFGEQGFPEWYSQDEAIGLLMGLALVYACMPDATIIIEQTGKNSQLTAQEFALLIIEKICGNYSWRIHNPDPNGDPLFWDCTPFSYGYAAAGNWFSNGTIPTLHYFVNEYNECMARGAWNNIDGLPLGLTNHIMESTLAAIGSSWHSQVFLPPLCPMINGNNTEATITNLLENYNIHTFYILLYKLLHPDVTLYTDPYPLSINQMNGAPNEGPFNYGNELHAGNGWAFTYKWRGNLDEQNNGSTIGNFSGCDYLLFYNLYILSTNTSVPDYHPFSTYFVSENWPVLEENNTTILGDQENPLYRTAFTSLLSDANILNSTRYDYQQNPITPLTDHPGNAIFLSENEINLKPGFFCEYGASLQASIIPHIIWETFSNTNLLIDVIVPLRNLYLFSDNKGCERINEETNLLIPVYSVNNISLDQNDIEINKVREIQLFPNPASQHVTIQIPEDIDLSKATLKIINNHGVTLYQAIIDCHFVNLNIEFLQQGVYMFFITSNVYMFQSRIVKI